MLGWTGNVHLTEHCGILKKLTPGDIILVDKDFNIVDLVGTMQAKLHIPAFTKAKANYLLVK